MQILVADRVWDGVSARPIARGFVRIEDRTITAVGRAADLAADASVRDLGDATILPGLINAHVHVTFSASTTVLDDHLREKEAGFDALMGRAKDNLAKAISVGVTTVRDLGTLNEVVFAARAAVRDGSIVGPDINAAGEGITSPGGHCHFFGIECQGTTGVRDAVRRQFDAGADVIKIFATGGNLTPGTDPFAPQYTVEELSAAVDEARSCALPITAHAHATEGIRRSIAARVDSIEHCSFETPAGTDYDDRDGDAIAEAGIAVVPTIGISTARYLADPGLIDVLPERSQAIVRRIMTVLPQRFTVFRRLIDNGVTFVAGTDAGIPNRTFDDFAADLEAFAGGSGLEMGAHGALVAATSDCARHLGLGDRGVLAPGMRADVLVVDGDPLESISDVTRTRLVIADGRVAVDRD